VQWNRPQYVLIALNADTIPAEKTGFSRPRPGRFCGLCPVAYDPVLYQPEKAEKLNTDLARIQEKHGTGDRSAVWNRGNAERRFSSLPNIKDMIRSIAVWVTAVKALFRLYYPAGT